jgi:DNA-binding Lrp family transcriptional regulator
LPTWPQAFGWTEEGRHQRLSALLESGMLTRFGPLFQIERAGGLFVLAAMAVPEERYDAVTAQVNAHPEVAHNYRRAHALNMWFVVAAETPAQAHAMLQRIEAPRACPCWPFRRSANFSSSCACPCHPAKRCHRGVPHGA